MRTLLLMILFIVSINGGKAQNTIDNFYVGPYEVDYRGQGDINYRLRKGIDLYEYYGLKKDTIIQTEKKITEPLKNGIQIDLSFSMPQYSKGYNDVFGLDIFWKQHIANLTYLNTGLLGAMSFGKYEAIGLKENMIEIGVPISIEISDIRKHKASIYGGIGVVPTYYITTKAENINNAEEKEKLSGIFIAPRLDFGGYIPIKHQLIRMGIYGQYNFNCSNKDNNQFKERIGRFFIGINLGIIF